MTKTKQKIIVTVCAVLGFAVFGALIYLYMFYDGYDGYTGKHADLYSIAVDSISGSRGYIMSERRHQPAVILIEEDEYGRKMFCYSESYEQEGQIYLIIGQQSDGGYAYYYPSENYIASRFSDCYNRMGIYGSKRPASIKNPLLDFTDEQIEKLKEDNDWGQELNYDKCTKVKIIRNTDKK
ncbi:MAG: hypothetical protein J1G38_07535 [Clostridiales bacterium]|nr:hypothetical protein [Clostridiales bacterium]